jgi:hypothetical protein
MSETEGGHVFLAIDDKEPFAILPARVLRDTELSAGARLLYAVLVWVGWREEWQDEPGYGGQEALGEEFGISRRSVITYMRELQDRRYIGLEPVGLGRPANITILPLPQGGAEGQPQPDVGARAAD